MEILLLFGGVSFGYFTSRFSSEDEGNSTESRTVSLQGSTINIEGKLEFNDTGLYPGHTNIASVKVTVTGKNELIPYNLI